jgi:hypothetical protein
MTEVQTGPAPRKHDRRPSLVELIGHVVLLLWGMHMVQSGVVRAFGSSLRRVISHTLSNRFAAIDAGLVVTAMLQSSTATEMMTTSLVADGTVALVPALAVMLGANIGTALIVKALSFDVSWIVPMLMIAGYFASRHDLLEARAAGCQIGAQEVKHMYATMIGCGSGQWHRSLRRLPYPKPQPELPRMPSVLEAILLRRCDQSLFGGVDVGPQSVVAACWHIGGGFRPPHRQP